MENRLSFDDGVRKISIYNTDDELLTVLKINVADVDTARRFVELIQNLEEIADSGSGMADVFKEKYKEYESQSFDTLPDNVKMEIIVDASKVRIDVLNRMIAEIDALFGKDTIRNVFKECYELHEDFVPDEDALIDFVNKVMPVMNELFSMRNEEIHKKYSPNRATRRENKHNKNKRNKNNYNKARNQLNKGTKNEQRSDR
mgnify:FL=1